MESMIFVLCREPLAETAQPSPALLETCWFFNTDTGMGSTDGPVLNQQLRTVHLCHRHRVRKTPALPDSGPTHHILLHLAPRQQDYKAGPLNPTTSRGLGGRSTIFLLSALSAVWARAARGAHGKLPKVMYRIWMRKTMRRYLNLIPLMVHQSAASTCPSRKKHRQTPRQLGIPMQTSPTQDACHPTLTSAFTCRPQPLIDRLSGSIHEILGGFRPSRR